MEAHQDIAGDRAEDRLEEEGVPEDLAARDGRGQGDGDQSGRAARERGLEPVRGGQFPRLVVGVVRLRRSRDRRWSRRVSGRADPRLSADRLHCHRARAGGRFLEDAGPLRRQHGL